MIPSIRPATQDDAPAVEAVVEAAYTPWITRLGRKPAPMLDDYRALIEAERVHVAERGGTMLGVLVLIPESDGLLLDNIAVASEAQGTGIGRALLAFAEQVAVAVGSRAIRLYTNEAMVENIALYTGAGFTETHRATEKGLRRVYMRKPLGTTTTRLA